MRAKLSDVAKKAGVSPTTVSRVINNYGYISDKTRNKVHEAMKELNYQPNSLARSLHGKKTNLVGLIFPGVSNPFFGELVEEIENKLFEDGYKVILCNAAYNKEKERSYLRMLLANQVDGIIAGAHNLGIDEYLVYQLFLLIEVYLKMFLLLVQITIKVASLLLKNFLMPVVVIYILWVILFKKEIQLITDFQVIVTQLKN